jgi:glycosyltransferase involved in cell wall biosynthesis
LAPFSGVRELDFMDNGPKILADARWLGPDGIGRFAREVLLRLPEAELLLGGVRPMSILDPLWLAWKTAAKRAGLFFSPGPNPPIWGRTPLVFTIHDIVPIRSPESLSFRMQLYFSLVVRPACHRAARILTVSEYSRSEITAWAGIPDSKVAVVGGGVSDEFTARGRAHNPGYPYLLHAGSHRPHKNVGRILRAFSVSGLASDFTMLFTGIDDAGLAARAAELGIAGRIAFTGRLPYEDMPSYYRGASALIWPSLYEGFGLPPLEAMACGTPVLTSRETSLPEVCQDAALYCDAYSVDDMAARMRMIVSDTASRKVLVAKGLKLAASYTWNAVAGRAGAAIREVSGR